MKKFSVYALSAAACLAMAGAMPITSQAAGGAFQVLGGNGKVVAIGGGSGSLGSLLGQLGCQPGNGRPAGGQGGVGSLVDQLLGQAGCRKPGCARPNCQDANHQNNLGPSKPNQDAPNWPNWDKPGADRPNQNPDGQQPGENEGQDTYAAQILQMVNQEREKAGLNPLSLNQAALSAAQVRAQEITRSFSHARPDGSSFTTALAQAGASFQGAGENIAYGQKTPQAVMASWMNSQGHRANILNPSYTSMGIGHYQDGAGVDYWTQLFLY